MYAWSSSLAVNPTHEHEGRAKLPLPPSSTLGLSRHQVISPEYGRAGFLRCRASGTSCSTKVMPRYCSASSANSRWRRSRRSRRRLITGDRDDPPRASSLGSITLSSLVGTFTGMSDAPTEFVKFERPASAGGCWDAEVHLAPHNAIRQIGVEKPTATLINEPIPTGNIFTVRTETVGGEAASHPNQLETRCLLLEDHVRGFRRRPFHRSRFSASFKFPSPDGGLEESLPTVFATDGRWGWWQRCSASDAEAPHGQDGTQSGRLCRSWPPPLPAN